MACVNLCAFACISKEQAEDLTRLPMTYNFARVPIGN